VQSAENSQHLADWYTFSHMIHGLLFYAGAHLLWRKLEPVFGRRQQRDGALGACRSRWRMEASWEVLENSPMIIERYRAVTGELRLFGRFSIVNSMADIGWMIGGLLAGERGCRAWVQRGAGARALSC
jgi:hypothetical protein